MTSRSFEELTIAQVLMQSARDSFERALLHAVTLRTLGPFDALLDLPAERLCYLLI